LMVFLSLLSFRLRTFLVAATAMAVLLLALVLTPQLVARDARLEVLRQQVDQVARLAASHIDGDLHRALLDGNATAQELDGARQPLMLLHETWPEAFYVFTMCIVDGCSFIVLMTAHAQSLA